MKNFLKCILCFVMLISMSFLSSASAIDLYAKVILVGDYRCGKTSLWNRIFERGFDRDEQASDVMMCEKIRKEVNGKSIQFNIWDTAGADKYYEEVVNFTQEANFVFIVHDVNKEYNTHTEEYLKKLYRDIHGKICSDGKIVLVGSKYDLRHEDVVNASKQVRLLEDVSRTIPCARIFTSAKEDNLGVNELIKYLFQESSKMRLQTTDPDSAYLKRFTVKKGFCTIL